MAGRPPGRTRCGPAPGSAATGPYDRAGRGPRRRQRRAGRRHGRGSLARHERAVRGRTRGGLGSRDGGSLLTSAGGRQRPAVLQVRVFLPGTVVLKGVVEVEMLVPLVLAHAVLVVAGLGV